jgi:hypothetical protein
MTISNTSRTAGPFIGNGITQDFPFSYKVFDRGDVLVALTDTATGAETAKVLDADYVVTLNVDQNSSPGGMIHMIVAPPAGTTLAATSNIPIAQGLDLTNQGGFHPKVINDALDRIVINLQQLAARVGLGLNVGAAAAVATVLGFIDRLATTVGASLVGFLQAGVGAVLRTIEERLREQVRVTDYMTAAQKADALAYTYQLDMTPAFAAAIARLIQIKGRRLYAPGGGYKLNGGAASGDGLKNGILLPDTNGDFTTANGITIVGDGVSTVFRAGAANMVVLRASRLYSGGDSFRIDGAGGVNVWGLGNIPESMTQTTELTSQSFGSYRNVTIENCTEAHVIMPGPTVGASDSGCFYFDFYGMIYNNNLRDVWLKKDVTGHGNRTTRSVWYGPRFTRGNTGVQIDGGTEIDFYSPNFEAKNSGVTPSAIPTAFNYNDNNPANIRIFGGYAEACTKALVSIRPEQVQVFGFFHTSTRDGSEFSMGRFQTGRLTIPKMVSTAAYMNMGGESFVGFVADPDQNNSRTLELQIGGLPKTRWNASGDMTFYGSANTATLWRSGDSLQFSGASASIMSAGELIYYGNRQYFRSAAGSSGVRIDSVGTLAMFPEVDNAVLNGQAGLRWAAVWAANGTIQTSDPRTKKDIIDSPLGLDFISKLRPVAYRFKVGGNKITGSRIVTPAVLDEDGEEIERAVLEPIVEAIPGKRLHYGFLTTEVKATLDELGVEDFGGWIKTDPEDPDSEEALRYDEFIGPLVRAVQQLAAKVATLEGKA